MRRGVVFLFMAFVWCSMRASDLVEVLPLTNMILMLHFDDGSIAYPNTLNVVRLDATAASSVTSYTLVSADDANYSSALAPTAAGRKTKGTAFQANSGDNWDNTVGAFNPTGKPWAAEHWVYLVLPHALQNGKSYTLNTGSLAANGTSWNFTYDEKTLRSEAVHVNTIGYAADAPKYGYIYHWMGSQGGLDLSSYAGNTFWVYKQGNPVAVKTGTIAFRKSATNAETTQGDDTPNKNFLGGEAYEADFSDITADGTYTLVVEEIGCSYPFKIGNDALWDAYYTVGRALYYQRSGIRLAPPYTDGSYIRPVNQNTKVTSDDGTSFAGKMFYSDFPFTSWADGNGGGTSKADIRAAAEGKPMDVAGWYHDAGDWDAYVSHQRIPILLMLTYEAASERFADGDLNLPESGNGIPDILDEASWLIKFNYRMRKELMARGYSDGGVGGARVCSDVYTEVDGKAEGVVPSWKETRRIVVTKADAFMTYFYAGQAAHFAYILKTLGKNPKAFPVEMLDAVDFDDMTKDNVDWIAEAEAAYAWATDPENQPAGKQNYGDDLSVYKMYAAVNLFRLTGKKMYHDVAKAELNKYKSVSLGEDQRYGVYSYLFCDNFKTDNTLRDALVTAVINTANSKCMTAIDKRACRWGGVFDMPMLIGQGTTPWVFETIIAYKATGEAQYRNAVHTTADYFLGNNPLNTTWTTHLGPRPAQGGFHLDTRYNNNWDTYPGFIPYGPWTQKNSSNQKTWTVDGIQIIGGGGSWDEQWHNFSLYPHEDQWPGHEKWCANIHSPMSAENTVHQNAVYGMLTYGFVNNRQNTSAGSAVPVQTIDIDSANFGFDFINEEAQLSAVVSPANASFAALKWESSNTDVAYVDQFGNVTAVGNGTATITCSTLDGSVTDQITITNTALQNLPIEEVVVTPATAELTEGQTMFLTVEILPENATNKAYTWSSANEAIAYVEDDELIAVSPGVTKVYATAVEGGKKDSVTVTVNAASYYVIADFDVVIPNTVEAQPDISHIFAPEGTMDVAAANPSKGGINTSDLVFKWGRPSGDWRLFGFDLPTDDMPNLGRYSELQFKYYGAQVQNFYIKLVYEDDSFTEINETAAATDSWSQYAVALNSNKKLKLLLIFVNKTGSSPAFEAWFDDFRLLERPGGEEVCVAKPLLDFETIELNWSAGYGAYAWSSNVVGKVNNPAINSANNSTKVVKWEKDATQSWGGVTVQMPENNTTGYNQIQFQVYANAAVGQIGIELHNASTKLGEKTLSGLGIEANTWSTVAASLPEMNITDMAFNKITFKIAGGTAAVMTTYVDNVILKSCAVYTTGVEISQGDQEIVVNEDVQLDITVLPLNATNKNVGWESSDETVATVSATGMVTGVGDGQAVITVTTEDGGYTDEITVSVSSVAVTAINIVQSNQFLGVGQYLQLTTEITPANATNQNVSWESSNVAVATVNSEGKVTAVAPGVATITVTSEDGDYTDVVTITTGYSAISYLAGSSLELYPNPVNHGQLVVEAKGIASDRAGIEIADLCGRIVLAETHPVVNGNMRVNLDLSALQASVYVVRLKTGHFIRTERLIVK